MAVTLTEEKILKIETLILQILNSEKITIREVARVIGYFISSYQQSDMVLFITER